ncbi:MAG: hypothetical protein M1833_001658 [Piccolia ochrophora]|nr:MAG: hypothetical protein M1833_001658 [Piccolia ochrophora]
MRSQLRLITLAVTLPLAVTLSIPSHAPVYNDIFPNGHEPPPIFILEVPLSTSSPSPTKNPSTLVPRAPPSRPKKSRPLPTLPPPSRPRFILPKPPPLVLDQPPPPVTINLPQLLSPFPTPDQGSPPIASELAPYSSLHPPNSNYIIGDERGTFRLYFQRNLHLEPIPPLFADTHATSYREAMVKNLSDHLQDDPKGASLYLADDAGFRLLVPSYFEQMFISSPPRWVPMVMDVTGVQDVVDIDGLVIEGGRDIVLARLTTWVGDPVQGYWVDDASVVTPERLRSMVTYGS